ncbi:Cullin family-domain-containing protein [Jimgerdemannia flammicorona]|uniref:Cullin family-domain-containing protein n=1 Tax=Jimgerdemannia flammicorona TaxID=994334 RepID=A0A433DK39_9FUNG|nr:Cullin family-domain-containing protein [Jimgerdemannia flammicorona]
MASPECSSCNAKYTSFCQRVFNNDPAFLAAVDKAFRSIVNDTSTNPNANGPEALARFCDMLLKKGSAKKDVIASTTVVATGAGIGKAVSMVEDGDMEEKLTRMITIFKYVDDKDVFQKFYSRMLAKRLIFSTSSSEEAEANMISRLKESCGVEYTSKLHRMFTDVTLSADLNNSFREFVNNNGLKLGVGFEIMVLTAGAWPLAQSSTSEFRVPAELEKSVSHFSMFYDKHHSGRKLAWLWNLGKDKHYELSVSLYQLCVLVLFNTVTTLAMQDVREHTGLSETEAVRSLVDVNILVLSSSEINDDTEILVNMAFSRTKVKISAAMQTDSPQETDATRKAVDDDRRLYLQAAIVRVMKARQLLTHTQLVNEVIDQAKTRFKPSVAMIKKCIEHLLEKQYLEREGLHRYMYVA